MRKTIVHCGKNIYLIKRHRKFWESYTKGHMVLIQEGENFLKGLYEKVIIILLFKMIVSTMQRSEINVREMPILLIN